jgi:glycerophosphoryl diester phosphodiesterase
VRRVLLVSLTFGLVAVPAVAAQAANRWIEPRAPLNIAHQGGEDEFPSNTMYAFRKALRAGADMLELDVGVTRDGKVVVMHDTTVDGKTNGHGTVASKTLRQIKRLDAAFWFAPRATEHYSHSLPPRSYRFRGIATGRREPPRGFKAADFRVLVVSFRQAAVDRFHELLPRIDLAPGIDGAAAWLIGGGSPGPGVVAFQVPITFRTGGTLLEVTTADSVARAHREGYAWQNWFSNDDRDAPATWRRLIDMCVDGIMTSRSSALERVLSRHKRAASCG